MMPISEKSVASGFLKSLCPSCGMELSFFSIQDAGSAVHTCSMCHFPGSEQMPAEQVLKHPPHGRRAHTCEMCGRQFLQVSALKRHYSVHTGERPFACATCSKAFKTKVALKRHEIIHTGECPFECSTCKRRFNQISNLRKHLVIHSNNCPFFCTDCGKGFNQLSNLKKHMVVHEERPKGSQDVVHSASALKNEKRPLVTFVKPVLS